MRTPKTNSDFLKKYYKSSTIPRLKDHFDYNREEIDLYESASDDIRKKMAKTSRII